jgi:hypothetical protein
LHLLLIGGASLANIKSEMKKKRHNKNEQEDDRLQIKGKFDNLFEGIDMKDGDESNSIPLWPSQCPVPSGYDQKQNHYSLPEYKIEFVYGGKMNEVVFN